MMRNGFITISHHDNDEKPFYGSNVLNSVDKTLQLVGGCPAHSNGVGTGCFLRPILKQPILWFYDSTVHLKLWCIVCMVQKTDPLPEFALHCPTRSFWST